MNRRIRAFVLPAIVAVVAAAVVVPLQLGGHIAQIAASPSSHHRHDDQHARRDHRSRPTAPTAPTAPTDPTATTVPTDGTDPTPTTVPSDPSTTTPTTIPVPVTTVPAPPVTTTTVVASNPHTTPVPSGSRWIPTNAPTEWQWELAHPLNLASATDVPAGATVFDIDGTDNSAATVAALHARGDRVICYLDAGTAENFRPDYSQFPAGLLGQSNGWPGENWLDTSPTGPQYATLQAIMTARIALCKAKGFDAVEPDNIDGAENSTGFPLTVAGSDQYAEWIASVVHSLGMSVAQKNFTDQAGVLEPYFDFAIDEQCFQYSECGNLAPYSAAGKAIFDVEYQSKGLSSSVCAASNAADLNAVVFDLDLDGAVRIPCR